MASGHLLHELLSEDQEPFLLHHYIADNRYCLLQQTPPVPHFRRHRSIPSLIVSNLCTNPCFFSLTRSPPPHPPSTSSSPPPSHLLLPIPPRTAPLLPRPPLPIHEHPPPTSTPPNHKHKHIHNHLTSASALFYSIFKKLTSMTRRKKRKTMDNLVEDSLLGIDSSSSPKWETSDKSSNQQNHRFLEEDGAFSMYKSFSSPPPPPPCGRRNMDEDEDGGNGLSKLALVEEKEQCSPVSVLDPPFKEEEEETEEDTHGEEKEEEEEEKDGKEMDTVECCYDSIQRRKRHLLQKLEEFEEIARSTEVGVEMASSEKGEDDVEVVVVEAEKRHNTTIDMMVEKNMEEEEESEGGLWKWRRLREEECHETIEVGMSVVDLLLGELSWELLYQECFQRS